MPHIPTETHCSIIAENIYHYFDKNSDDPHQYLANALGVSRNDAKELLYSFLYKEDAWFPRMFRRGSTREIFFLNKLGLKGEERKTMLDKADKAADDQEDKRFPK